MDIFDEPKIDCHAHVLDPARFPYAEDVAYKPSGQEIGTAGQLLHVMQCYGVKHVLLVQPNSGYGGDNRCMLDAVEDQRGAFTGIAIVEPDADIETLRDLKRRGIVGVAFNPTVYGNDYYARSAGLIERLAQLDMFLNLQVEHDQLLMYEPWITGIPVRVMIDHCGRPTPRDGLDQPGFRALLRIAATGRVHVKLSGYAKFAQTPYPFDDCLPYVRSLVDAFTLQRCLWASDWPYLRAADRQDVGPLVHLVQRWFPDPDDRRKLFWETPAQLLGVGG